MRAAASSAPRAATWRAVWASERGSSHGSGSPNQDAVRCDVVPRPGSSPVWVAAVADGHGGSRYVRSDVGARTAVDVAVDAVRRALEAFPDADPASLLRAEVAAIVSAWRDAVRAHAAAHPFSVTEVGLAGGRAPDADDLDSYGSTLLVAVVGEHGVAVAQVGDGDALVRSHGFATRPVPGDERLVAGATTSLCLPTAVDDFRHWSLAPSGEPDLVLLATDGYGNSFAQKDWWHDLLGDFASLADDLGCDELERRLPEWLAESARVGGDDVSAVLLVREPLTVAPMTSRPRPAADPEPERPLPRTRDLPARTAGTAGPVAAPPGRTRRRVRVLVLAVCLAVAGCAGALVLLLGRFGSDPPADTPTDPITTTSPSDTTDESGEGSRRERRRGRDRDPGSPQPPPEQGSQEQPGGSSGPDEVDQPLPGGG